MTALSNRPPAVPPLELREPTPEEREVFLAGVRAGRSPSKVAQQMPCDWHRSGHRTASMFGRLANRDPEFSAAYAEALAERERVKEDEVDDLVERRASEPDAPPALVLGYAARWHRGFRWRERALREDVEGDLPVGGKLPEIDPARYTEAQLEQFKLLLLIGSGRIPNPELDQAALGSGEVDAA